MKKILNIIPILLVVFAIGGSSFGTKEYQSPKNPNPVLYWFDEFGDYTGRQNTQPDEVAPSGCPDSGLIVCERGYSSDDLIDINNPDLGLKSTATADDYVMKNG